MVVISCTQVFLVGKDIFARACLRATYFLDKGRDILELDSSVVLHEGEKYRNKWSGEHTSYSISLGQSVSFS
jgi:hypothetical protein